jgi:protein gp37
VADTSAIQWTDATWNVVTGCTKVGPGCAHCYIERTPPFRMAGRRFEVVGAESTTGVVFHRDRLDVPMRWRKPRRIFTCSLGDLFHEAVDEGNIRDAFSTMARCPQHTFQVLTKRPERARELYRRGVLASRWVTEWPLPNVWLGVSIENARMTWRADVLRQIPAAVRFISAEPLLGSLYEGAPLPEQEWTTAKVGHGRYRKWLDLAGIDWVIVGGESGPGARPFHLEHAREIIRAAEVECDCLIPYLEGAGQHSPGCAVFRGPAVFVKQLGAKPVVAGVGDHGFYDNVPLHLRDRKGGDPAEWPADLRIREFPRSPA